MRRRLQGSLGGADRRKLDEYLYVIREIETPHPESGAGKTPHVPDHGAPSPSVPTDFAEHARIMMDLMTLAFQTDSDARGDAAVGASSRARGS